MLYAGAATLLASPLLLAQRASAGEAVLEADGFRYRYLAVENLSSFQKSDMRAAFLARTQKTIKENLDASDAPACVRLALLDAGSYDAATKAGGISGAIIRSGAPLPPYIQKTVEKLKKAKAIIDADGAKDGSGAISWADMIYLSGKVTSQAAWRLSKGEAANAVGDPWSNPWEGVVVGRIDSDTLGPNKVPALDAPVEEIRDFLSKLGAKPGSGGFLSAKPPFWERPGFLVWAAGAEDPAAEEARLAAGNSAFAEAKADFDKSRRSLPKTSYEIEFAAAFNKLCNLGAKLDPNAYLFPVKVIDIKL